MWKFITFFVVVVGLSLSMNTADAGHRSKRQGERERVSRCDGDRLRLFRERCNGRERRHERRSFRHRCS